MKRPVPASSSTGSSPWFTAGAVLLVALLAVAAIGSLSLLYLRQQVERTAQRIQDTQRQQLDVERRLEYLDTRIAALHQPEALRLRVAALGLKLRPPERSQIVHYGPAQEAEARATVAAQQQRTSRDGYALLDSSVN